MVVSAYVVVDKIQGRRYGVPMYPDRRAANQQRYWERNRPPFTYKDLARQNLNEAQARLIGQVATLLLLFAWLFSPLWQPARKTRRSRFIGFPKAPLEESAPQQQDAMPTNTAAPRMPGGLAPAAETAVTTPPNWEPQPLSQMRQASFLVKGDRRRGRRYFICEPGRPPLEMSSIM